MTAEEWLEKNAFECAALSARISPQACATYRKGRTYNQVKVIPSQCQACTHSPKATPLPRRPKRANPPKEDVRAKVDSGPKILKPRARRSESENTSPLPAMEPPARRAMVKPKNERPALSAPSELTQLARRGNRAAAALLERLRS